MLSSFDKLSRMLTQEKRLGYKNKAVFGGLEKLASNWGNEALQEAVTDEERALINEMVQNLARYSEIAEADRPHFIHRLLVKLHKTGATAPSTPRERETPASPPASQAEPPVPPRSEAALEPAPAKVEAAPQLTVPTPAPVQASSPPPRLPTPPKPARLPREAQPDLSNAGLDSSVTKLPGIKEAMAKKLANLGVRTIGDFLSLYPRRYDDYRTLKPINQLQYGE
jgi:hypothetical protein